MDSVNQSGEFRKLVVDLFAGPGGWSEALRALALDGVTEVGIEYDAAACATRHAAGHLTVRADVAQYPTGPFVGLVVGVIASPPCPTFSTAGKGEGIDDLPHLHTFIDRFRHEGWTDPWQHHTWGDPRTPLILEPLRWVAALEPVWVALEQVPPCLPIWHHMALAWREAGFSTWAGVLNAADYGVPQTRKRAFCLAHRTKAMHQPEPTHERDPQPSLFGELRPWVSMASALGWGMTAHAAPTITGGGTSTGGPEPIRNRDLLEREREHGSLATEGHEVKA